MIHCHPKPLDLKSLGVDPGRLRFEGSHRTLMDLIMGFIERDRSKGFLENNDPWFKSADFQVRSKDATRLEITDLKFSL